MERYFTSESLAFLTVAVLVIGIAKFIIYYKSFNVAILRYIDPSEIVILFADNILAAAPVTLTLATLYIYKILPHLQSTASTNCVFYERLNIYINTLSINFLYLSILSLLVIAFSLTRKKIHNFERVSYLALAVIIIFFIPLSTLEIGHQLDELMQPTIIINIFLILNFLVIVSLATLNEIRKVKQYGYFTDTLIYFDGFSLQSNKSFYYVGMTKNYIFFYSTVDQESVTYPANRIRCIKYRPA